jgi:hypothetical protein
VRYSAQSLRQSCGIGETPLRLLEEAASDERLELLGEVRPERGEAGSRGRCVNADDLHRTAPCERGFSCQRLEKDDAERVDIRRRRDRVARSELRSHVEERSEEFARGSELRALPVKHLGDPEIEHFHLESVPVGAVDENIRRLQVAVDDAAGMSCSEHVADLGQEPEDSLRRGEPAGAPQLVERRAVEALHDDETRAVRLLAMLVDAGDAGMLERRARFGFHLKPLHGLIVGRAAGGVVFQDLDRDDRAIGKPRRLEDSPHAPLSEEVPELVPG